MREGFASRVVLCWPSDRADIDELNSHVGTQQKFEPTIEHSLSTCDSCRRSIWITPQQLDLARSVLVQTRKLCFFCVESVNRVLCLDMREVDLSPEMRSSRKRRA